MENRQAGHKKKGIKMKTVLQVRKYAAGYEVRKELIDGAEFGGKDFIIKSAYVSGDGFTSQGDYIGDSLLAYRLCKKGGIIPEKSDPSHNVCSIGFCAREQKWYGWSHRARYGFKIGDEVKEGDCCASSGWTEEYLKEHPEENTALPIGFIAKNLDDCKKMAIAFAESVS